MDRPPIPRQLERDVLVEAGHRCAIPRCRQTPVVIALCPTCHARYDGGEIDRKAMLQYKANLSVLNGRYSDLERRVLEWFAEHPNDNRIQMPIGFDILLSYLIKDRLLSELGTSPICDLKVTVGTFNRQSQIIHAPSLKIYELTKKGGNSSTLGFRPKHSYEM